MMVTISVYFSKKYSANRGQIIKRNRGESPEWSQLLDTVSNKCLQVQATESMLYALSCHRMELHSCSGGTA